MSAARSEGVKRPALPRARYSAHALKGWLLTAGSLLLAAIWAFPIYGAFASALSPERWDDYGYVLEGTLFLRWFLNSVVTSAGVTVGVLFLGASCGYALSQLSFPGRKVLWVLVLAAFIVPTQALIITHFQQMHRFGLLNSWGGVILPQLLAPLAIIVYRNFFDALPKALRESAQLDSATELRIFRRIYLPLTGGVTAGLGIVTFIGAWNTFLWPFLAVTREAEMNIAVAIDQVNADRLATAVLASIPVILVYALLHRRITDAVALTGGLKG